MSRDNYTNLKNTYLNNKTTDRINFYQNYKNDNNSLDDPIFTGFTLDIDFIHSPLFFTDSTYEESATETLRGSSGSNTALADAIENRLTSVYKRSILGAPDSYEINTVSVKDLIDATNHTAGYGLQDKFYLDNVLYGATEYIYMVDKVSIGSYSDETGTTDVGNGTPTSSVYDTMNNSVYNARVSSIEDDELAIDEYVDPETGNIIMDDIDIPVMTESELTKSVLKNEINKIANSISPTSSDNEESEIATEHNTNKQNYDSCKSAYETLKTQYDNATNSLKTLQNEIAEQKNDITETFNTIKDTAQTELNKLLSSLSVDSDSVTTIDTGYDAYNQFMTVYWDKYDVEFTKQPANQTYDSNIKELTDEQKAKYDDGTLKTSYENAWEIINTRMTSIKLNSVTEQEIQSLKESIKSASDKMYGTDKTISNYDADSVYGKYMSSKNTLANDTYSQLKIQQSGYEDALNNYDDLELYNEYASTKNTTTSNLEPLPTAEMDENGNYKDIDGYRAEVMAVKNTRKTYEVPQTVYDILGFIKGMKKLTYEYPYVMQTVSGLDEAYKKYFNVKDPYMGSGEDKITITCFESLDLRVSSMFNKYFNAAYDRQYRRERLPVNMRRFECSIFVHDIRNFRSALGELDSRFKTNYDGDSAKSKIVEMALNYTSVIEFKFYDCEIVPEETGAIFDSVSNESGGEMKKTNFTFTYGNCVINFMPFEDLMKYYSTNRDSLNIDLSVSQDAQNTLNDTQKKNNIITEQDSSIKEWEEKIGIKNATSTTEKTYTKDDFTDETQRVIGNNNTSFSATVDEGNFRRWFDKSELGNVNNNDYRDYVRNTTSVEVDDAYRTSIVNNFALNSVTNKQSELTEMDDALRTIVQGISSSTGMTVSSVTDALNISNIYSYINSGDGSLMPKVGDLGFVNNTSSVINPTPVKSTDFLDDTKKIIGNNSFITSEEITEKVSDDFKLNHYKNVEIVNDSTVSKQSNKETIAGDLGNVYSDSLSTETATDLGYIDTSSYNMGTVTDLGDIVEEPQELGIVTDLGDAVEDYQTGDIVTDLGDTVEDYQTGDIVKDLGNV